MKFIPDEVEEKSEAIIFFEDARAEDGWAGQSTDKSYERLKGEVLNEIDRLKGTVTRWSRGVFEIDGHKRAGIQIEYEIAGPKGLFQGRFNIAALPRQKPFGGNKGHSLYDETMRAWQEESLRMALFNTVLALRSGRILGQLSPGYSVLVPFLIGTEGKTIAEIWSEGLGMKSLPSPDDDAIDVPFREVDE